MILIFISLLIVALGQPAWSPLMAPLAAALGYALFWKKALQIESKKKRFWLAVGWFTLVQSIQTSWMTAVEYQGYYILFVFFFVIICMGLQFGLLTSLIPRKKNIKIMQCLALAGMWTLLEWSRLYFLCGFSFNFSGMALTSSVYSMQLASLWGILGLSFWVILVNLSFLRDKKVQWVALALIPYLFGFLHIQYQDLATSNRPMTIGLVQTNLLPPEKLPMKNYREAFIPPFIQWARILYALDLDQKLNYIVLPEAAVPFLADQKVYPYEKVKELFVSRFGEEIISSFPQVDGAYVSNIFFCQTLSNFFNAELFCGFDDYDESLQENYQSAFYFSPQSNDIKRYEKQILVPLGEYLPFEALRSLTKRFGITEFYTPGKSPKVFQAQIPVSLSICYEETFGNLMRQGRLKGAELFINLTNDNWFANSKLPKQHFDHARLRTVENGIPLIRACNIGVTAAVDSLGRMVFENHEMGKKMGMRSELAICTLNASQHKTLYMYLGDLGIVVPSIFFVIFFYITRYRVKKLAQNR